MTRASVMRMLLVVLWTGLVFEGVARVGLGTEAALTRIGGLGDVGSRLLKTKRAKQSVALGLEPMQRVVTSPLMHHPERGWVLRVGRLERPEGTVTVTDNGRWTSEPPEQPEHHVVLLGDSFTFGDEVGDSETWAAGLARGLPRARITNRGVLGYGLDQIWLTARADLQELAPDVVVVGITAVSVQRVVERWGAWRKPRAAFIDGQLRVVDTPIPSPDEVLRADQWGSRTVDLFRLWREWIWPMRSDWKSISSLAASLLNAVEAEAAEQGAEIVWVYLPQEEEYEGSRKPHRTRDLVASHCARTGARYIDLTDVFQDAAASGTALTSRAHWLPAGHVLVSGALTPALGAMLNGEGPP